MVFILILESLCFEGDMNMFDEVKMPMYAKIRSIMQIRGLANAQRWTCPTVLSI